MFEKDRSGGSLKTTGPECLLVKEHWARRALKDTTSPKDLEIPKTGAYPPRSATKVG
jgi:hypothetical protein